jgi:cell division topological specificity factor
MNILDYIDYIRNGFQRRSTASVAKERLQIIVSHESSRKSGQDIIKQLQKELLEVLSRYIHVDQDQITVQLERNGDQSVLELNVMLPEGSRLAETAPLD